MRPVFSKTILSSALVGLLSLGVLAPSTASEYRTFVAKCQRAAYKPHSIVFACADGNFSVTKLHWRHWSKRWAVASGIFHANDCKPDCADGHFHHRPGVLLLTGRMWCARNGKFVFKRETIRYTRPSPSRKLRWTHDLTSFCPM